ncbi:F-box protein [Medicago truncatula]|uniref:F-box protein n=1 Tax=Medicago truncatula TaxID=3880 RepID=G7IJX8_MEDTR|nr:F-box protein [Medicago truncatula]
MSEQEVSTAAIDRFRSLSDDILVHILSSVPTKQAVATSITCTTLNWDNRKNKYITRNYIPNWVDPKSKKEKDKGRK